jgi:hypothetical protein
MMGTRKKWRIVTLACVLFVSNVAADPLERIWQLQLHNILHVPMAGWDSYGVWALSFSPDGRQLAIGFGDSWRQPTVKRRLAVVNTADPREIVLQVDLNLTTVWVGARPFARLAWAPDGKSLALGLGTQTIIVGLRNGSHCELTGSFIEFMSDNAVLMTKVASDGHDIGGAAIADPNCVVTDDSRIVPGVWVSDFSRANRLFAVHRHEQDETGGKGALMNLDNAVIMTLAPELGPSYYFMRDGRTVCGRTRKGMVSCQDIGDGPPTTIPVETGQFGDFIFAANRIAISEFDRRHMPRGIADILDLGSTWFTFKRRVIWDVDQQKIIAAYQPEEHSRGHQRVRFAYALSPDGMELADGGHDKVTLFRISK